MLRRLGVRVSVTIVVVVAGAAALAACSGGPGTTQVAGSQHTPATSAASPTATSPTPTASPFRKQSSYTLVRLPLTVTDGSINEVDDPGPTRFLVPPSGSAWFAIGTGTAYGGPLRQLTYLTIYPTANTTGIGVLCGVNLSTDSPAGKPIPVSVTAFAPGPGPTL